MSALCEEGTLHEVSCDPDPRAPFNPQGAPNHGAGEHRSSDAGRHLQTQRVTIFGTRKPHLPTRCDVRNLVFFRGFAINLPKRIPFIPTGTRAALAHG